MNLSNPALGLAAARIAIGGVAVAAPDLGAKLFRLSPDTNRQLPFMTRLFGGREIALGAATLLASGRDQRTLVWLGVGVDAIDAAAAVLAARGGAVSRPTGGTLAAPALAAIVSGVAGVGDLP